MQTISFGQLLLNRIKRHPITSILLAINLIMFFVVSFNGGFNQASLIKNGGLVPTLVSQGEVWRILTAMFLHAGFLHFFMNSFFLYYIGSFMERILGSLKYTVLYFASGAVQGPGHSHPGLFRQ